MSRNKTIARKRARKNARRADRQRQRTHALHSNGRQRVAVGGGVLDPVCILCGTNCAHDGVLHEWDYGPDWLVCPLCAVRTCVHCINNSEIVVLARHRDSAVEIGLNVVDVERLNEKVMGARLSNMVASLRMFMNVPVACGGSCKGSMIYVDGSERWPSHDEQVSVPDALFVYDRTCTVCGRRAPSIFGDLMFDEAFDSDTLQA